MFRLPSTRGGTSGVGSAGKDIDDDVDVDNDVVIVCFCRSVLCVQVYVSFRSEANVFPNFEINVDGAGPVAQIGIFEHMLDRFRVTTSLSTRNASKNFP